MEEVELVKSVIARKSGDEYQDDWFWYQASRIFLPDTVVDSIGYEVDGLVGFDDVVVYYNNRPNWDEFGNHVNTDYFQVKYHVDYHGSITANSLIDPAFINSKSSSLLQRVQVMQKTFAPDGNGIRLFLVTPWSIHPDDVLSNIISTQNGQILFDRLFDSKQRSKMGIIRKMWINHLGLKDEEELKLVLRPFRILPVLSSKIELSKLVNNSLVASGLVPINKIGNQYHALIRRLHQEGKTKLTRSELVKACKDTGLLSIQSTVKPKAIPLGIKSFSRWTAHIEDETTNCLNLVSFFNDRSIRNPLLWNAEILPRIYDFLQKNIQPSNTYHLYLDIHSSICFVVGYVLGMKTGANVLPMQRIPNGYIPWEFSVSSHGYSDSTWIFEEDSIGNGNDTAIALSVTHDVLLDVRHYISKNLPSIGRLIHARVKDPSSNSIKDGDHAFFLAQQLLVRARTLRSTAPKNRTHLFFASPNGLVYFLGKHCRSLGNISLYEYDFESGIVGAYSPSFTLPR